MLKTIRASFFVALALLWVATHVHAQEEFPEGSLWRAKDDARIYVISQGRKRHIPNEAVFVSYGWKWRDVRLADSETLFAIPDTRAIKTAASPAVYDIISGKRILFRSADDFESDGFSWDEVAVVNQTELESYPSEETESIVPVSATPTPFGALSSTPSALWKKIAQARELLLQALPLYPQEKRIASFGSLSRGDNGSDVQQLQLKLKELRFFPASVEANGNFGPATERAVQAFQKARNISAIGVVGPQTQSALAAHGLVFASGGVAVRSWRAAVPSQRDVLVAAWNEKTDDVRLVHIAVGTKRMRVGGRNVIVPAVHSKTPGFAVRYASGNGINTNYDITDPPGYVALANRFPIFDASSGLATWPPSENVYVPYRDTLRTPEIVEAGRQYLSEAVALALEQLRRKGVASASGNGLVADLANPDEMKNIAIIEHIDHSEFRRADDKHGVVNKVFTVLGTNREMAYRFSGSSAGALGLAQFIKSTYAIIHRDYPKAQLIPNFQEGMANHVNAFQAMALYMDVSGATLESYARERIASNPDDLAFALAEMRAAAYNGGAGRVKKTVQLLGPQWSLSRQAAENMIRGNIASVKQQMGAISDLLKKAAGSAAQTLTAEKKTLDAQLKQYQKQLASVSATVLRSETVGYLEKFRVVREILMSF